MKKLYGVLIFLLCLLSTGCGREQVQYYDIVSEEQPFQEIAEGPGIKFQGMQFYQGEPAQIWSVKEAGKIDIYLYRMDGSREILQKDMPDGYDFGSGYIDGEGNYYHWNTGEFISKTDPSGKRHFSKRLSDMGISSISRVCETRDGDVYVAYVETGAGITKLGSLDPATGEIARLGSEVPGLACVGAGQDSLYYLREYGVEKVDAGTGHLEELWTFAGTTYILGLSTAYPVWDFQVQDDGSLEILRADKKGKKGVVADLRKEPVGKDRKLLSLRGIKLANDRWLKECVSRFNRENNEWYVVLEDSGPYSEGWDDYAMQTSVEIAAGKGPDILYGDVLMDYEAGIFQKGKLADLAPFLGESGMKEDDFFPWAFDYYRDGGKLYSVTVKTNFSLKGHGGILMDAAALGGKGEPDMETLADFLLAGKEGTFFVSSLKSDDLLDLFLKGSESLWGAIDWETGTCSFDTELFRKIMEAAKKFGDRVQRGGTSVEEALKNLEESMHGEQPVAEEEFYRLYQYLDRGQLEEKGKVRVGIMFDDGCHACASETCRVMVNDNSDKKEGAWEFIRFLLDEGQPEDYDDEYPASRKAFDAMMEKELAKGRFADESYRDRGFYSLDEGRIRGIREILEDARFIPQRTQPILEIIHEEAQTYFSGVKTIEEVCGLIGNRVQVYLDESSD